jgi:uncharacterized phage infection (PIP) family protein YhgE
MPEEGYTSSQIEKAFSRLMDIYNKMQEDMDLVGEISRQADSMAKDLLRVQARIEKQSSRLIDEMNKLPGGSHEGNEFSGDLNIIAALLDDPISVLEEMAGLYAEIDAKVGDVEIIIDNFIRGLPSREE